MFPDHRSRRCCSEMLLSDCTVLGEEGGRRPGTSKPTRDSSNVNCRDRRLRTSGSITTRGRPIIRVTPKSSYNNRKQPDQLASPHKTHHHTSFRHEIHKFQFWKEVASWSYLLRSRGMFQCRECVESCATDKLDCYIIDGNGYIVLSENRNDTGRFFGDIEGEIMEAMISESLYRQVPIFDYQALCFTEVRIGSGVDFLWTPVQQLTTLFAWFLSKLLWLLVETSFSSYAVADIQDYYDGNIMHEEHRPKEPVKPIFGFKRPTEKYEVRVQACDQLGNLFLLQKSSRDEYRSAVPTNRSRPLYVERIPHTNLLLIVVNTLHRNHYHRVSAQMEKVEYNDSDSYHPSCQKLNINSLPRRRLSGCFNTHPLEEEINMCGKGTVKKVSYVLLTFHTIIFLQYLTIPHIYF